MNKEKLGLRILLLVLGIFIVAHGVALSIRSDLGTSPISSMPYVLNLIMVGTDLILYVRNRKLDKENGII